MLSKVLTVNSLKKSKTTSNKIHVLFKITYAHNFSGLIFHTSNMQVNCFLYTDIAKLFSLLFSGKKIYPFVCTTLDL